MKDEALRLALEALEDVQEAYGNTSEWFKERVEAVRKALEQPELEPVAWVVYDTENNDITWTEAGKKLKAETPLYTSPPKREWQGLTDEELKPICDKYRILFGYWVNDFSRAIESKLKEKNDVS